MNIAIPANHLLVCWRGSAGEVPYGNCTEESHEFYVRVFFFISAMNECEIRGIRCPFGSECKNSAKSAHDCVCAKGFKLFEEKQKPKKCEGRKRKGKKLSSCSSAGAPIGDTVK